MNLHSDCVPLAFLLGSWKGVGAGHYPTIEPFGYNEEVVFSHVGKPFIAYSQRTRHSETGMPLHAESGYLRAVGGDAIEFVVVQPSGIIEIHTGRVEDQRLELQMQQVQTTPTAKSVTEVRREVHVTGASDVAVLSYDVAMAAVGEPLTHHLHAELNRQPANND